jgi:hypothetical protein
MNLYGINFHKRRGDGQRPYRPYIKLATRPVCNLRCIHAPTPLSLPSGRNNVKGYVWAALIAVVVSLAIVTFTHVTDPITSYSFLLTDWISRPDMVSQCMIRLNRGPDPQDQDVWKAMGIKDPATQPYLGRLRYCYEGFWGWQRAVRPRSG